MGKGGARKGAGRPKINDEENKRTETLSIRATKNELRLIKECSEIMGTTRANTIMKAIEEMYKNLKNNKNL